MNQEKIGKFIAELRKEKNMTQEQLANKLGITDRAISKWENGRCLMDISFLEPLSKILDVSVVEILNGEKLMNENICKQADKITLNTLNYAKNKIKHNKIKNIIVCLVVLIILFLLSFVIYKGILLSVYNVEPIENYETFVKKLEIKDEIKIYKKTINDQDYLSEFDIKIRNDFKGYTREVDGDTVKYNLYDGDTFKSAVWLGKSNQYIDMFTSDSMSLYIDGGNSLPYSGEFTDADRKYFLLKNDINNDLDFLEYIRNNYYIKSNVFTSKRAIKENYAINLFVSVTLPNIQSITLITGDYTGYIFNINEDIREVHILRNDISYFLTFNGDNVNSDEYIQDILSSLEIR